MSHSEPAKLSNSKMSKGLALFDFDGTITSADIAANTITADELASDSVTSDEIDDNTITSADIAANTTHTTWSTMASVDDHSCRFSIPQIATMRSTAMLTLYAIAGLPEIYNEPMTSCGLANTVRTVPRRLYRRMHNTTVIPNGRFRLSGLGDCMFILFSAPCWLLC